MDITRIGPENFDSFSKILPYDTPPEEDDNILLIGAIKDDRAAGAMSLYFDEDSATLESIYVVPELRRKKVGSKLLKRAVSLAKDMEYPALGVDFAADEGLAAFFRAKDFLVLPASTVYYATAMDFADSSYFEKSIKPKDGSFIQSLSELEGASLKGFGNLISQSFVKAEWSQFNADEDLTQVLFDKNHKPVAYMLVTLPAAMPIDELRGEGNAALVSMLYSGTNNPKDLLRLFIAALSSPAIFDKDIKYVMFFSNDNVMKFASQLLGKKPLNEKTLGYQAILDLYD